MDDSKLRVWIPINETFSDYPTKYRVSKPSDSMRNQWIELLVTNEYYNLLEKNSHLSNEKILLG